MAENRDSGGWHTTRDRDEIRKWARRNGAVPVDRGRGETDVALEREPVGEEISWERFFEVFDREDLLFRYREGSDEGGPDHEVVTREGLDRGGSPSEQTHEPRTVESRQHALSDTGDSEPVAFERVESGGDEDPAENESATTPAADEARGPSEAADRLVLDAVHEHRPGEGSRSDEHVAFVNDGERPLDLSGWRLANEAGRSYRFPDGTVLEPDERLTVHSGEGRDGAGDRYWDADEPVWRARGDTVIVETPDGERALEVTYKGGRSEPS